MVAKFIFRLLIISLLPIGLGCTKINKPLINAETTSLNEVEISDTILDTYFSQRYLPEDPGGAILIKSGNKILLKKGYGISDIQTREQVTTNTLFNLGSISKTFVSNSILILQAKGKLSVNDNLAYYFPQFKNQKIAKAVTIKHLLTHTSGLPDIRFPYSDSVFYLSAKDEENWKPIQGVDKLNFDPGSNYEYSNPAFNGLALIIEKTSSMKWQQFVAENIFKPAGMLTSTITDGAHPESGVAHAYLWSNKGWIEKDYGEEPTFAAAGNGGVWSSVEELSLYHDALLSNIFLSKELQEDATTIKTFKNWSSKTDPFIGWSWFIHKTKSGNKVIGHTGSQGGFRANFQMVPDKGWLVIMLSSTPRNLEEYTDFVFEYLDKK